jgi:PleD family two-component response regulator
MNLEKCATAVFHYCLLRYSIVIVADEKDSNSSLSSPKTIIRLLVIDDEKDILTVIKRGLEINGVLVGTYTNPSEAIEIFAIILMITAL